MGVLWLRGHFGALEKCGLLGALRKRIHLGVLWSGLCELLDRSGLCSGLCELLDRSGLCSGLCELLDRSGLWSGLCELLAPPAPSPSCLLPPPPWSLLVILLPGARPLPEPPPVLSACLPSCQPFASPVTIPHTLLFPPPKSSTIPPFVPRCEVMPFGRGANCHNPLDSCFVICLCSLPVCPYLVLFLFSLAHCLIIS